PSVLFGLAPRGTPAVDASAPPLTLRGLAGRLRRELTRDDAFSAATGSGVDPNTVTESAAARRRRSEAASALAELAAAGVPGADPGQWHGLLEPSSTAPLYDE